MAFAATVPVIQEQQLQVGNTWTWTYYTEGDLQKIYSAEKYQVIEVQGPLKTFEISSRYNNQGDFRAHTRFQVNFRDCQKAYKHPSVKTAFFVKLYNLQDGRWSQEPIEAPSLIFEEKFNCNAGVYTKDPRYETRFAQFVNMWGAADFFQQWPKLPRSQIRSYYFSNHPLLRAIAYIKDFNPGTKNYYQMVLTSWDMAQTF